MAKDNDEGIWIKLGDLKRLAATAPGDLGQAIDDLGASHGFTLGQSTALSPTALTGPRADVSPPTIVDAANVYSAASKEAVYLNSEGSTDSEAMSCPHCGGFIRLSRTT